MATSSVLGRARWALAWQPDAGRRPFSSRRRGRAGVQAVLSGQEQDGPSTSGRGGDAGASTPPKQARTAADRQAMATLN